MAEYFFPGPTAGFYGTDGKDGRSIFLQGSEEKKYFLLPFKSYHEKGNLLCSWGSRVTFSESQSLSEPVL